MIYDEALEEIKNAWNGNPLTYPKKTVEALERAKKVEELLGLYQEFMANLSGVVKGEIHSKDIHERMIYLKDMIDSLEEEIK